MVIPNCILFSKFGGNLVLPFFIALALGDPTVTLEDVTPRVYPSGTLFPNEVFFGYCCMLLIACIFNHIIIPRIK